MRGLSTMAYGMVRRLFLFHILESSARQVSSTREYHCARQALTPLIYLYFTQCKQGLTKSMHRVRVPAQRCGFCSSRL